MRTRHLITALLGMTAACCSGGQSAWENVTNNVGGTKWGYAGVTLLASVPGNDEIIAGVSDAGLWSTTDGGATWQKLGADDKLQIKNRPYQIIFDPKDPEMFWVSGSYGPGIFKTFDGGKTFERLGTLNNVDGLAVDFTDPERKTLLAGLHEQPCSLHKSTDGGKTWERIGKNLPEDSNFSSDPILIDSRTFIVNTAGWKKNASWGIYRTSDAGATWDKVSSAGPNGRALITSEGTILWQVLWSAGLISSSDQGQTWIKLTGPIRTNPIQLPDRRLVAPVDNRLFISMNAGVDWDKSNDPLPFNPNGIVFNEKRRCFFAWHSTDKKTTEAIMRSPEQK